MPQYEVQYTKARSPQETLQRVTIKKYIDAKLAKSICAIQKFCYGQDNPDLTNLAVNVGRYQTYFLNDASTNCEWFKDLAKLHNMMMSLIDSAPRTYLRLTGNEYDSKYDSSSNLVLDTEAIALAEEIFLFAEEKQFLSFTRQLSSEKTLQASPKKETEKVSNVSIFPKISEGLVNTSQPIITYTPSPLKKM